MIALYRGKSLVSRLIQWQTRSRYSHAAWVLGDGSCIEAWHIGGVQHHASPYSNHTPGTLIDYYTVRNMSQDQARRIEWFLKDQVGKRYDWGGVARFLSRREIDDPDRWFCSELVAAACLHANIPLLYAHSFEIAPGHLAWSTELHLLVANVTQQEWDTVVRDTWCQGFGGRKL